VSGVSGRAPVASGFSLPALWIGEGMASTRPVGVWRVWTPDFGHRRNDLPGHADCTASLVSRHVVGDHPEEWGQRFGIATSTGTETIPDGLDDAASIAPCHGKTGTRLAHRQGRS